MATDFALNLVPLPDHMTMTEDAADVVAEFGKKSLDILRNPGTAAAVYGILSKYATQWEMVAAAGAGKLAKRIIPPLLIAHSAVKTMENNVKRTNSGRCGDW
jgi:hypothetical protein